MAAYGKNPFYVEYGIGANSRLICEGWFPNPHQGRIFNLVGTQGYFVKQTNEVLFPLMVLIISKSKDFHLYSDKKSVYDAFYTLCPNFLSYSTVLNKDCENVEAFEKKCLYYAFLVVKEITLVPLKSIDIVRITKFIRDCFLILSHKKVQSLFRIDQVASALQIWSVLSDCKYYQRITNLFNNDLPIDPFIQIFKDFISPALEREISSSDDEGYVRFLTQRVIPVLSVRKIIKYYIFPFFYNLSVVGVRDKLVLDCQLGQDMLEDGNNFSYCMKTAHLLHKAIGSSSPDSSNLKDLLNATIKLISTRKVQDKGVSDKDTMAISIYFTDIMSNFEYRKRELLPVSLYQKNLKDSSKKYIPTTSDEVDLETQFRATLSLLIQSFDARLLFLINKIGIEKYGITFIHIHDCHLCDGNQLH